MGRYNLETVLKVQKIIAPGHIFAIKIMTRKKKRKEKESGMAL